MDYKIKVMPSNIRVKKYLVYITIIVEILKH